MGAGVWNLVIGIAAIAAGASGRFQLIGTSSSPALMLVGGAMAVWGVVQLLRSRRSSQ